MIAQDREEIKKNIEEKIVALKLRIESLCLATKPISPDNALGRLTRVDAMQMKAVAEAGLERCRVELQVLEQKLSVVDTTGFGVCRLCGEDIAIKRLMALPGADTCIACAERRAS